MSTVASVKAEINSLISSANAKTGESDTTLHDAVSTLIDGYYSWATGKFTPTTDQQVLEVTGLGFTPKKVAVKIGAVVAGTTSSIAIVSYMIDFEATGTATDYKLIGNGATNSNTVSLANKSSNSKISYEANDGGFRCSFKFSNGTMPALYKAGSTYTWVAMG